MASPKVKKRYGTKRAPETAGQEALHQADEIEEGLVGLWEWVRKYRYVIVGVLGVLLVVTLGGQFFMSQSEAAAREDARAFNEALSLYAAPVQEPGDESAPLPEDVKTFPSEAAKLEAVKKGFGAFAADHDGDLAELAKLAPAAAQFQEGNYDAALATAQGYLSAHEGSPLQVALDLQRAYAVHAQGKAQEAAGIISSWGQGEDWWFQSWSALVAGDLAEDPAAAKASWQKGLDVFEEMDLQDPAAKFVKSELERRLALAAAD